MQLPEEIENNAPMSAEKYIEGSVFAQNGRFELYPTQKYVQFYNAGCHNRTIVSSSVEY